MQTDIAVHDTDQKQGNVMNINPNHGSSRKEKKMSAPRMDNTNVVGSADRTR